MLLTALITSVMSPKIEKMGVNILLYGELICKEIHHGFILINCSVVFSPR